jgi:hypothetical protein
MGRGRQGGSDTRLRLEVRGRSRKYNTYFLKFMLTIKTFYFAGRAAVTSVLAWRCGAGPGGARPTAAVVCGAGGEGVGWGGVRAESHDGVVGLWRDWDG